MLQQPPGILPVWVEDGKFHPFSFMESAEEGDWVLNVVLDEKTSTEGVRAGHMRFCHHRTSDRIRAQCFYMFGNPEPFLWRIWFADTDGRASDFEWFVRFGGKWWWVPLRDYRGDAESPHTIRFHVMVEKSCARRASVAREKGVHHRAKQSWEAALPRGVPEPGLCITKNAEPGFAFSNMRIADVDADLRITDGARSYLHIRNRHYPHDHLHIRILAPHTGY